MQDGSPGYGFANAMVYTTEEDARLICAAPEMLAALRKAVAALEILDEDSDVAGWRNLDATYVDATIAGLLCHLEQCIAKAEGVTMEGTNGKERSLD
jgi:hypothetical protein